MNHVIEFPRQKADTEQAIRDHIPAYAYDPPVDDLADYLELKEWAAAYYGVHPDTLDDFAVQNFSQLTGTVVRRG